MEESLKKTFVIDTNVLLFDPQSIFKFRANRVVIPLVVIEELDRFKKDQNENGRNARYFSRLIDELRQKGSLFNGVELEHGGELVITLDSRDITGVPLHISEAIDLRVNDNIILLSALKAKNAGDKVVLVTKDINLRLKADAMDIQAEDYDVQDFTLEELYTGHRLFEVSLERLDQFEKDRCLDLEDAEVNMLFPNEYLIVCEQGNERHRLLGRFSKTRRAIVPLVRMREGVWGIYPKNVEQQFALDALLNDEIKMVTLVGKAGTGKTLLAIAAGLEMSINQEKYHKLLVSRPVQPMGKDLGYLPGDVNEKLAPWMQPIFDNMDFLFGQNKGHAEGNSWEELINQGLLHVEPLTYIRGRSIPQQYMIVDESQNLSPHEVKTILTRAGEGTKIILTGDCQQIDSPYLDSINNGLAYCVERLKVDGLVAHVTLVSGERSPLSEAASKLL